jgi:hypothetical protein
MESTLIFPFAEVAAGLRRLVQVHIIPDHDEQHNTHTRKWDHQTPDAEDHTGQQAAKCQEQRDFEQVPLLFF